MTRIVVGDPIGQAVRYVELPRLDQLEQQVGVMNDLPSGGLSRVLVSQSVKRMGVGCEDPLEPAARDRLDVVARERLEESLLPHSTDIVAGVAFSVEED